MLPSFDLLCLVGWWRCFFTFFTSQNGLARHMWSHLHFLVLFGVKYPRIFPFSLLFVRWFGHDLRLVHSPIRKRWHCLPCDWFTSQDDHICQPNPIPTGTGFPSTCIVCKRCLVCFACFALLDLFGISSHATPFCILSFVSWGLLFCLYFSFFFVWEQVGALDS